MDRPAPKISIKRNEKVKLEGWSEQCRLVPIGFFLEGGPGKPRKMVQSKSN